MLRKKGSFRKEESMSLISKKELLTVTGISYGQLYRWKRQRLIPEEWFMKKASYTGQETFFPREAILNRVETILKLKDTYSMEQLAEMFTKGRETGPGLSPEELAAIEELPLAWRDRLPQLMDRDTILWDDVVAAVFVAGCAGPTEEEKLDLLRRMPKSIPVGEGGSIALMKVDGRYHVFILKVNGMVGLAMSEGIEVEPKSWNTIADPIWRKYRGGH